MYGTGVVITLLLLQILYPSNGILADNCENNQHGHK